MPYFSITVRLVRSLTVIMWSAFSIPSFSMAKTVGLTLPRERSKSVACTWMTSGFPVTFLACIPAGYVSQSCECMTSQGMVRAITPATIE